MARTIAGYKVLVKSVSDEKDIACWLAIERLLVKPLASKNVVRTVADYRLLAKSVSDEKDTGVKVRLFKSAITYTVKGVVTGKYTYPKE